MERIRAALPIPARATPGLQASLRKQDGIELPVACTVTWITYGGDEGGIMCQVEGGVGERVVITSLTHLRFDPRPALARDILAYQRHRVKLLRKRPRH